jgi:UDPglucose 6-dehydrogenase
VSSINSISAICEKTGANILEVSHVVGLDARIGSKFLKAGLGFAGPCLEKDTRSLVYIAQSLGLEEIAEYWNAVLKINTSQLARFKTKIY